MYSISSKNKIFKFFVGVFSAFFFFFFFFYTRYNTCPHVTFFMPPRSLRDRAHSFYSLLLWNISYDARKHGSHRRRTSTLHVSTWVELNESNLRSLTVRCTYLSTTSRYNLSKLFFHFLSRTLFTFFFFTTHLPPLCALTFSRALFVPCLIKAAA